MDVAGIGSTAVHMKQAEFQQQVGIAVAKKAMDLGKQAGADLALLLNSTLGRGTSPAGIGENLDILA